MKCWHSKSPEIDFRRPHIKEEAIVVFALLRTLCIFHKETDVTPESLLHLRLYAPTFTQLRSKHSVLGCTLQSMAGAVFLIIFNIPTGRGKILWGESYILLRKALFFKGCSFFELCHPFYCNIACMVIIMIVKRARLNFRKILLAKNLLLLLNVCLLGWRWKTIFYRFASEWLSCYSWVAEIEHKLFTFTALYFSVFTFCYKNNPF